MINTSKLRFWIGFLGMVLPWIVVLLQLFNPIFEWPSSISATWYTNACTPFMIILGAAGILLVCYDGYDLQDMIICTLAGIAGLLICLFPCALNNYSHALVGPFQVDMQISGIVHNISAFTFFGLLAYNSLFLFTKSAGEMTENKKKRNIIFKVCGIGMIASFLGLLLPAFPIKVWLIETFALSFFGISWLTKANIFPFLFMDEEYRQVDDDQIHTKENII